MNNVLEFAIYTDAAGTFLVGLEPVNPSACLFLGRVRLATDPDDRDLTGSFRELNLPAAVAPGDWPNTQVRDLNGLCLTHRGPEDHDFDAAEYVWSWKE